MVLDPDMLLQVAKKSAENSPAAGRGRRGGGGGGGAGGKSRNPHSHVDGWKSINGRPFTRWIDPAVDVWDERFEGEGPSNAEWLQQPPVQAELDRAEGVMEVRVCWVGCGVYAHDFFRLRVVETPVGPKAVDLLGLV